MRKWIQIAVLALSLSAMPALAQDPTADGENSRQTSFVAVEGPARDSVPGGTLLVAAYGVVFALVFLYVARLAKMQAENARSLQRLAAALDKLDTGPTSPDKALRDRAG